MRDFIETIRAVVLIPAARPHSASQVPRFSLISSIDFGPLVNRWDIDHEPVPVDLLRSSVAIFYSLLILMDKTEFIVL